MTHEDIVISVEGENFPFIDTSVPFGSTTDGSNLLNLLNTITPSTSQAGLALSSPSTYFTGINTQTSGYLPNTWEAFSIAYNQNSGGNSAQFFNSFLENYREMLGMSPTVSGGVDGDLAALGNQGVTNTDISDQFKNSFSHFLSEYPYEADGTIGLNEADAKTKFLANWARFMTQTAVVSSASLGTTGLAAFEQIYLAFGFPAADFETKLKAFYDGILEQTGGVFEKGYFIPSLAIDEWLESIREEYLQGIFLSSVGSPASNRVLVIDRILRLLISMIDVLQKISASQAQRLNFLTNWQQAYTELLLDVPSFTKGDGTAIDGDVENTATYYYTDVPQNNAPPVTVTANYLAGTNAEDRKKDEEEVRNDVNPKMQAIQEKIRARRGQVSDWSKAMQSSINQSQDSANQQTDIATALLQQLSTILASIFR